MNNLTRWERYAPFSLGVEDMFARLDALADNNAGNYPPYNIVRVDEHSQELHIALAGISKEDISVAVERGVLTVSTTSPKADTRQYIHRGIAARTFARNWQLGDNAEVGEPKYENGMLMIPVSLKVPEAQKRRELPIT